MNDHMADECTDWLFECRNVFPKLDRFAITAEYKKIRRKGMLGYVKGSLFMHQEVDVEALFLRGKTRHLKSIKDEKNYQIFINDKLKKIKPDELRKQIVQNIMIHELLHVERKDNITRSKKYSRRKRKKMHVVDFHEECLERFNRLREMNGMPRISSYKELREAESTVARKFGIL